MPSETFLPQCWKIIIRSYKVSYQTEEQQVEQLKEWWNDNGTPLIVGAVLGLSGFFGWKYWNEEQVIIQNKASDSFLVVTDALDKNKSEDIANASQSVKSDFPDSNYAVLSAFQLAKQAVKNNELEQAITELEWVLTNHPGSDLASIAKIRIARVLIAQDKAEKALSYLNFTKDSGYVEMANLVKGDAFLSLGKETEALEAYQSASSAGKLTANHPTLKMKIASLQVPAFDLGGGTGIIESSEVGSNTNDEQPQNDTSETKNSDISHSDESESENDDGEIK